MATDDALEVLLKQYKSSKYEFREVFLKQCYEVQRQYQFDRDRAVPVDHLRRLVEAEVDRILKSA